MVDYLYTTRVWFNTENVIGVDPQVEAARTADFEANFKSQCYEVDGLEMMDTYFRVDWDYETLKAKIAEDGITWTDVKLEITEKYYDLFIITPNQL